MLRRISTGFSIAPPLRTAALAMMLVVPLSLLPASGAELKRPRILGVAHIALFAKDINQSRAFYKDFLGLAEPFSLQKADGSLSMTFIKVNDRQYIELFPERAPNTDRLNHFALQTDDAEAMREYLASRGVKVPDRVPHGRIGNANFTVQDPDGHTVEMVQYEPDGWTAKSNGRLLPASRISQRILHVGILVGNLDASMKFYRDVLGFQEFWRGSKDGKELSWVNMRVPDGSDYIELMLYKNLPAPTARGGAHHLCLEVPSVPKAVATLRARPYDAHYGRPMEIHIGKNRKRQTNLYDPDGTRVEIMEPETLDGVPAPLSTAPPLR